MSDKKFALTESDRRLGGMKPIDPDSTRPPAPKGSGGGESEVIHIEFSESDLQRSLKRDAPISFAAQKESSMEITDDAIDEATRQQRAKEEIEKRESEQYKLIQQRAGRGLRPCLFRKSATDDTWSGGHFHCWGTEVTEDSYTVAIVEDGDGNVYSVLPERVRFAGE